MIYYITYFNDDVVYGEHYTGYYVKYKDKCSDVFSNNYIDAKRYKTIKPAFNKIRLNTNQDFIELYKKMLKHPSIIRQKN
ncbi:hypothetical protein M0Q50_06810 [bacterium]|jgi:hypothetical protein|nr:hypothetical protein [bacterium]